MPISLLLFCCLLTYGLCWLMQRYPHRFALDQPNQRSLHQTPVPRTGGIALMISLLLTCWFYPHSLQAPLMFGLLSLFLLSLLDDYLRLSALIRLTLHCLVSLLFLKLLALSGIVLLLALLMMVWLINLYNFMDGADGLAAGMSIFGFGAFALAYWQSAESTLALISLTVVCVNVVFLLFNWSPAKIFMGDSGSIPLGFLAAALGIAGVINGYWNVLFIVLVFLPFIMDATVTLIKRLIAGENPAQAHRSHYYQRLIRMGWSHGRVARFAYLLMLLSACSAIVSLEWALIWQLTVLFTWLGCYAVFMRRIDRHWSTYLKSVCHA